MPKRSEPRPKARRERRAAISPYLFFWQARQEVEDTRRARAPDLMTRPPEQAPGEFTRVPIGMAISNLVTLFIVITTAATLHAHGVIQVQTSAQAAEALRAVAGPLTFVVFAVGIIGTGMPALLGSAVRWARRSPGMSVSQSAAACQGALRDHRGGHGAGRGAELLRHRSDPALSGTRC